MSVGVDRPVPPVPPVEVIEARVIQPRCSEHGCDEPAAERCLRHELWHVAATRGLQWLMAKAMAWMAEFKARESRRG